MWNRNLARKLRKNLGLTLGDVAAIIGVRERVLGDWERGLFTPSPEQLKTLAGIYNCDYEELVRWV